MRSAIKSKPAIQVALRRRVRAFFHRFNAEDWEGCFSLLDPNLRTTGKVVFASYRDTLAEFKSRHGPLDLWHIRGSFHPEGAKKQGDPRPFAFVYILWQDGRRAVNLFRERWVLDEGRWYSRVVGLVSKPG